MKFTVALISVLSISSTWAVMEKVEDPKKREAPVGYPSSGHSLQTLQIQPSQGHDVGSAISIGAGYSIGGAKPSYSFGGHGQSPNYQLSPQSLHSSGGHSQQTIQLPPITLSPEHGSFAAGDLSQLMSQLSHGLSTGQISLQSAAPSYQGQAQEYSFPQFAYAAPKEQQQQYQYSVSEQQASPPSYAAGTKGLGSYGSTGPVLFNPSSGGHASQPTFTYGTPSSGHSFGDASASLGGLSFGNSGHSFGGLTLGGSGHSFSGPIKSLGGSYGAPSKNSFKPSAFIGASESDSGHGLSGISSSYASAPSFGQSISGGHSGLSLSSGSHVPSFGGSFGGFGESNKYTSHAYLPPKSEGFGSSSETEAAFAAAGHSSSPPGTTYGIPSGSYLHSSAAHGASSSPQYYISSSKHPSASSFGSGSSSSYKAPLSSHGSVSSFSSGPKYSFGSHSAPSTRYSSPKDTHGAYSETSYNTIKYSEELKPRVH